MDKFFVLEQAIDHLTPSVGKAYAALIVVGCSSGMILLAVALVVLLLPNYSRLVFRSLFRNPSRTLFTALGIVVLVFVASLALRTLEAGAQRLFSVRRVGITSSLNRTTC